MVIDFAILDKFDPGIRVRRIAQAIGGNTIADDLKICLFMVRSNIVNTTNFTAMEY